ncbi:hypothetical protein Salat_1483800 [Sesamum alatum]|uniref:Uncharacterized protein n=1 Tax=Sesamum alatum TaxID=300844 RepID=A0AAE1YBF0_9LAMI|nr:hypothetical protein Salat_1483800 [Sesamum alatum]
MARVTYFKSPCQPCQLTSRPKKISARIRPCAPPPILPPPDLHSAVVGVSNGTWTRAHFPSTVIAPLVIYFLSHHFSASPYDPPSTTTTTTIRLHVLRQVYCTISLPFPPPPVVCPSASKSIIFLSFFWCRHNAPPLAA